ncbi:MAG TPA: LamG-like jellyroll fold domain-containing protein, partial [Chitinophagales bacterium]|nr:LamG-like jellyroll fold domain-containing protein [Chitinophagales bacterium]
YEAGNTIVANSAIAASPPGQLATAGYIGSSEFSNGDIAEIIVYNRVLTTAERNTIEGYLTYKYAIQNVPLASMQAYQTYAAGANTVNLLAADQSGNRLAGTTTATTTTYPGPAVATSNTSPCSSGTVTFTLSGMAPGGNYLDCSASAAYLNVSPNPVVGSNWTLQAWVQFPLPNTGGAGNWNTLYRGTAAHHVIVSNDGTNKYLGVHNGVFNSSGFKVNTLAAGWHHVAAVGTGGTTSFYIDGIYVGKSAAQCTDNIVAIGNYQGGAQQSGQMDEVSIWNTALSQNAISNYMTQAIPASHPNYANLVSYYKMDGNGNDSKGSSPGTLTSGATASTAVNYYAYNVTNNIGGTLSPASGTASETFTISNPSTNGTVNFVATRNSCTSTSTASAAISILASPVAPSPATATPATICQGSTVNLNATSAGNTIRWYTAATGGSPFATTASGVDYTVTPATIPTTNYYAEAYNGLNCPSPSRTLVAVTVNATSGGGTVSSDGTICSGNQPAANITLSGNTGSVVKWQKASDAAFTINLTDIAVTSTTLTPAQVGVLTSTTYIRAVVQNGVCAAVNSTNYVTITVNQLPAITSVTSSVALPLCGGTTVLTANGVSGAGATVTWWTGAGATGTNLGTGTTLTAGSGQTYYARVTGSCTPAVEASLNITLETTAPTAVTGTPVTINNSPNNSCRGAVAMGAVSATDNCSAAGVVVPLPLTGLVLWTKADAGVITDGSGNVSQWKDLSGNGNHFVQPTFASRPQVVANVINGQPVIRMSTTNTNSAAASRWLYTNTSFSTANYTIFSISKMNGGANYRLLASQNTNWLFGHHGGYQNQLYCGNWIVGPGPTVPDANAHMYCMHTTGSSTSFYENGNALVTNSAIAAAPPGQLATSGYVGSSEFSNGDIAEVIVYNRVLTTAERNTIEGYLSSKYNIAAPQASALAYQTYPTGTNTINILAIDQAGNLLPGTTTATVNNYPGPVVTPSSTSVCGNQSVTFTLSGMAPAGNALTVTAAAAYLNASPNPVIGSSWTIQSWVQFPLANTGGAGNWNTLIRGVNNHHIIINNDGTNKFLGAYQGGFFTSGFNTNTLSAGWHHIAAVGSGGGTSFYVDGVYVGRAATQCTDNIVAIGNYQGANQQMGVIDEVSIWNTTLTQNAISNYMTQDITASHPNYANLVSYYKMDGNGNDSKGSSPGTLTSGATASAATAYYNYTVTNGIGGTLSPASGSTAESFTITNPTTAGTVSFVATKNGCNSTTVTTPTISIVTPPTANAGAAMASICQGGTSAALGGSIGGAAVSGTWSSNAGGTFNPNATTLNATWTPPGVYSGTATLTLTATGGTCPDATASKTIVVGATPVANVGGAMATICQASTSAALGGSVGGSATGGIWSDGGLGGTFNPNATTLNATYSPPVGFTGTVTFTLTTTGGPCTAVSATKTMIVDPAIVPGTITGAPAYVNAGNTVTYTATGFTSGASFVRFQYQWNSTAGAWTDWGATNPYTWTASDPGWTLYVRSVIVRGACTVYSSPVGTTVLNNIGWTAESQPGNPAYVPALPTTCGTWSGNWCAGSGTYTHLNLTQGIAYTVQNVGGAGCAAPMANAYLQAWSSSGGSTCGSWNPLNYPGLNSITFVAPITGDHIVNVTSNALTTGNACGSSKAWDGIGSNSAVLQYRQSTTVTASVSASSYCYGINVSLISTLSGGGNNPTVTWSLQAGGGNVSGTTYIPGTYSGSVTVRATVGVCYSDVVFTINGTFAAGSVGANQTICYNTAPAGLTNVTSPSGGTGSYTYQWQSSPDNSTWTDISGAQSATYTPGALTATTYFRRNATSGSCGTLSSNVITVTVQPQSSGGVVFSSQTVCYNTPMADIGLNSQVGSVVKWQKSNDNFGSNIVDIANTTTILTGASQGNLTADTWFRAVVQSGAGCATANSATVKITVTPVAIGGTVAADQTICYNTPMADLTLSGYTGSIVKWQKSNDNFVANFTDISNTSASLTGSSQGNLTQDTWFRAMIQNGSGCAPVPSLAAKITVNPASNGGTLASAQTICTGEQIADLSLSGQTGSIVKWQKSTDNFSSNITDIVNTTATLTGASQGALSQDTWYRVVVQSGSGCTVV